MDEDVQLRCRGEFLRVCCEAVVKRPQGHPSLRAAAVVGPGRVARLLAIGENELLSVTLVMCGLLTGAGVPRRVRGR